MRHALRGLHEMGVASHWISLHELHAVTTRDASSVNQAWNHRSTEAHVLLLSGHRSDCLPWLPRRFPWCCVNVPAHRLIQSDAPPNQIHPIRLWAWATAGGGVLRRIQGGRDSDFCTTLGWVQSFPVHLTPATPSYGGRAEMFCPLPTSPQLV